MTDDELICANCEEPLDTQKVQAEIKSKNHYSCPKCGNSIFSETNFLENLANQPDLDSLHRSAVVDNPERLKLKISWVHGRKLSLLGFVVFFLVLFLKPDWARLASMSTVEVLKICLPAVAIFIYALQYCLGSTVIDLTQKELLIKTWPINTKTIKLPTKQVLFFSAVEINEGTRVAYLVYELSFQSDGGVVTSLCRVRSKKEAEILVKRLNDFLASKRF